MLKTISSTCFLTLGILCHAQIPTVPFHDAHIRYEGRILEHADAAEFSWSGTSATITFRGTQLSAVMKDLDTANYYNVIVDGRVISKFHTDTVKKSYVLATGLKRGKHTVQLFKRTEWDKGKTWFYGFEFPGKAKVLPPPALKKRKIEFYGNSITCGYANEDSSGKDSWFGYFQNNYLTYAAITARHFNAQYHCIAKSGIGIMLSWFPLIMPEMYDRCDPTDPGSKWDFSVYTPDVVVINLFQNDSWLVQKPDHAEFKSRFGAQAPNDAYIVAAYKDFVSSIRHKYPDASIICALGSMDATRQGSPWPDYIRQALAQMNDPKTYVHFFEFKNTGGHPNVEEQQIMADSLIGFIEKNIDW
ncbi:MAG: SGNH/GDSL hydrolase family protein [Breznakibacter sp.]